MITVTIITNKNLFTKGVLNCGGEVKREGSVVHDRVVADGMVVSIGDAIGGLHTLFCRGYFVHRYIKIIVGITCREHYNVMIMVVMNDDSGVTNVLIEGGRMI